MFSLEDYNKIVTSLERQVFRSWATTAQDFERDLFIFMKENHVAKVFIKRELVIKGNDARVVMQASLSRPNEVSYEIADYNKLLEMSDSSFDDLPYTTNKIFVKEWRDEMKGVRNADR